MSTLYVGDYGLVSTILIYTNGIVWWLVLIGVSTTIVSYIVLFELSNLILKGKNARTVKSQKITRKNITKI